LSIKVLALFSVSLLGMVVAGFKHFLLLPYVFILPLEMSIGSKQKISVLLLNWEQQTSIYRYTQYTLWAM